MSRRLNIMSSAPKNAGALCAALFLVGCDQTPQEQITLQVGPEQVYRFGASSGFAHYYELPGRDDVLRVVLASYPLSCAKYQPPKPGDVFIAVTISAPSPQPIQPGSYGWRGVNIDKDEGSDDEEDDSAPLASALPFVRLAEDARALPPGGGMKLTTFEPETFGLVEGDLQFRDAAAGQAANTALMGHFSVRLCHVDLDPSRQAPPKEEAKKD